MEPMNVCMDFRYGKIIFNKLDQYIGKSLRVYGEFWLYHFFCGMSHPTYINGGSCR